MGEKTYVLPNGKQFQSWSDKTDYKTVLHVSQKYGTEDGDGSEKNPFLRIEQVVLLATSGTKVVIHEGVYRETVRHL